MLALINDDILDPGDKVLTFDYMVSTIKPLIRGAILTNHVYCLLLSLREREEPYFCTT